MDEAVENLIKIIGEDAEVKMIRVPASECYYIALRSRKCPEILVSVITNRNYLTWIMECLNGLLKELRRLEVISRCCCVKKLSSTDKGVFENESC